MTLDELVGQEAMQPWEVSLLKVLEPEKADPREIIIDIVWDGVPVAILVLKIKRGHSIQCAHQKLLGTAVPLFLCQPGPQKL